MTTEGTALSFVEHLLDTHRLQLQAGNGKWYDIRRNGATKRWKTAPLRASVPVKMGYRDAFRLEFDEQGRTSEHLRERPVMFDVRKRA